MNILYTLIIVTQAGAVHLSPGIKSRALCEDARQVAETGRTVAEEQTVIEAAIKRAPKPTHPGEMTAYSLPMRLVQSSDPKYAKCVIMPEDK